MAVKARFLLALLLLATAGCPDPKPDACECASDPFEFEISGNGAATQLYDDDGTELDEISIDLTDCACADSVTLVITHREGANLVPPPESVCVLEAPSNRAPSLEITMALGQGCELDWIAIDSQPPVLLPIKVRP